MNVNAPSKEHISNINTISKSQISHIIDKALFSCSKENTTEGKSI
jgi:hypothetical protein